LKTLFALLAVALLVAGCVQDSVEARAKAACQDLCLTAKGTGRNLADGPCLGRLSSGLEDWVCDVAHDPRQSVDNLAENQCEAFSTGAAHHFIEVDETCSAFRAQ